MSIEYDLDTSGGLMPRIQEMIAPPVLEDSVKKKKEQRRYRRPGRSVNRDSCDSCKEGGDLICCDRCPAAFHLACYDPPLSEEDLPAGEWLCYNCKHTTSKSNVASTSTASTSKKATSSKGDTEILRPLDLLISAMNIKNPAQYKMPSQFVCNLPLPGTSKRHRPKETKSKKPTYEYDPGLTHLPAKLCYQCKRSCHHAPLIQCDYCPVLYHADCLDPPLTSLPVSRWMCPNHAEHKVDLKILSTLSLSSRVKLYDKFNGPVNQDAIKLQFLNKINKPQPYSRRRIKLFSRTNVPVPGIVVQQYKFPPPILPRVRDPIPRSLFENTPCNDEEITKWLGKLVQFQTEVVTHLGEIKINKLKTAASSESNTTNDKSTDVTRILKQPSTSTSESTSVAGFMLKTKSDSGKQITTTCNPAIIKTHLVKGTSKGPTLFPLNPTLVTSTQKIAMKSQGYTPEALMKVIQFVSADDPNRDEARLNQMEDKLMRLCAFQFIKQVFPKKKETPTPKTGKTSTVPELRARAVLVPLDGSEPVTMTYRSMHLGLGADMDVCFSRFGHCNYVSTKHATIFYDEYTKQYELLNYSCYGTTVDNVLYSSDVTEKRPQSPSALSTAIHRLYNSTPRLQNIPPPPKDVPGPSTAPRQKKLPRRECQCHANPSDVVQDCTGWEGTALLHHGSYIRCGCLQFVFSITEYGYRFQFAKPREPAVTIKTEPNT